MRSLDGRLAALERALCPDPDNALAVWLEGSDGVLRDHTGLVATEPLTDVPGQMTIIIRRRPEAPAVGAAVGPKREVRE